MATPENWRSALPYVLLRMRTVPQTDLNLAPQDLAFGESLRLPGELTQPTRATLEPAHAAHEIQRMFRRVLDTTPRTPPPGKVFLPSGLKNCIRVLVRDDKIKPSLNPKYTGPHKVLVKKDRYWILEINGKKTSVSLERIKPYYELEVDKPDTPEEPSLFSTDTKKDWFRTVPRAPGRFYHPPRPPAATQEVQQAATPEPSTPSSPTEDPGPSGSTTPPSPQSPPRRPPERRHTRQHRFRIFTRRTSHRPSHQPLRLNYDQMGGRMGRQGPPRQPQLVPRLTRQHHARQGPNTLPVAHPNTQAPPEEAEEREEHNTSMESTEDTNSEDELITQTQEEDIGNTQVLTLQEGDPCSNLKTNIFNNSVKTSTASYLEWFSLWISAPSGKMTNINNTSHIVDTSNSKSANIHPQSSKQPLISPTQIYSNIHILNPPAQIKPILSTNDSSINSHVVTTISQTNDHLTDSSLNTTSTPVNDFPIKLDVDGNSHLPDIKDHTTLETQPSDRILISPSDSLGQPAHTPPTKVKQMANEFPSTEKKPPLGNFTSPSLLRLWGVRLHGLNPKRGINSASSSQ